MSACSGDELVEQQSALHTLHTLQQWHAAAWAAAFPMSGVVHDTCSQQAVGVGSAAETLDASGTAAALPDDIGMLPAAASSVQVLQGGRGLHRSIQPGSRVKVRAGMRPLSNQPAAPWYKSRGRRCCTCHCHQRTVHSGWLLLYMQRRHVPGQFAISVTIESTKWSCM